MSAGSLVFPIVLTTKKTLIMIKTIGKTSHTNWETFNSETFFSQASCKIASFPLVWYLIHECYAIPFPDFFRFFHWRRPCFFVYFHILTSQKRRRNEIGILFSNLRRCENSEKLHLLSTNKIHVYTL